MGLAVTIGACSPAPQSVRERTDRGNVEPIEIGWADILPAESVDLPDDGLLVGDAPSPGPGQVVLVNFWASTCPPCREEMPLLQELHDRGDVLVVGVTRDRFATYANEAIDRAGVSYANVQDVHNDYAASFHGVVPPNALPSSALIVDGKAVRVHLGPFADMAAIESGLSGLG